MRFSIKSLFILILLIGIFLVPFAWLFSFRASWGPAEESADKLHAISYDVIEKELTEQEILDLLETTEYRDYGLRDLYIDIPKRDGELIRFYSAVWSNKYGFHYSHDRIKTR